MQKLKHNVHLIVIIAILFVTGLTFAKIFNDQNNFLMPSVSADDDGEDEEEEEEDEKEDDSDNDRDDDEEDEDDDEDRDDDDDEDDEDRDDSEDDDEDENSDKNKKSITPTKTTITSQIRNQESDDDEDENEVEDEDNDEDDVKEEINDLNKDIKKVELKINVLASNGVSVDAFQNSLSEVKDLISQAQSNPLNAESVLETAEHKLEKLEKLVKMLLKDDDEDEESVEEATEEIQELERDINKLEKQLNVASTNGVDVTAYRSLLADAKSMLDQAKNKLSQGLYIEAEALAELAEKKLDKVDDAIEDLFEDDDDDDDDDTAEEYKNEVALFVHNIKELGEIEGGIGQQVRIVAQAQNDSETKVQNSIKKVEARGDVAKFFLGPKFENIKEIKTTIIENQTRIKVLTDLANQITDPAVKQVLQDQITILTQQNANLQKFVKEQESGFSLLGWLFRLFA